MLWSEDLPLSIAEEFAAKVDYLFDSLKTSWSRGNEDSMGEKDKAMAYWFMKMKQGAGGEDFARDLWQEDHLVGVMFGTWKIEHVLDEEGKKPDPGKLTAEVIDKKCPQAKGIDKGRDFNDTFLWAPRTFLLKVSVGDRVVVVFDEAIHIGTIGEGYRDDPNGPRGESREYFKCRPVVDRKSFRLADLPTSYRLISSMGRRAIQHIEAYKNLVLLLDEHCNAQEIKDAIAEMSTIEFLGTLSDKQWEVVCDQYLRDTLKLRSLLLAVGGTLKGVDVCGVDQAGNRILAQCKNDSIPWKGKRLAKLIDGISRNPEDHLYFCCRGGVKGSRDGLDCRVVDGDDIQKWLDDNPDYLGNLKTL